MTVTGALREVEELCLALSADLISSGFLRGTFRSPLDTVLALAVGQANLAHMARDLTFQKTYAGLSRGPPDHLRRPVRSRSIAVSLGIPQETVRRRIDLMVKAGILVRTNAGVFMPKSVTETPNYASTVEATWAALGTLYGALRRKDALPAPAYQAHDGEIPYRYMMRLWGDHFLRLIETLLPLVEEPLGIVLLFAILRASRATEAGEGESVSVSALSRDLGVPFETARRNTLRLAENGLCEKAARGYHITPRLLETPAWRQLAERHRLILLRFFGIMGERNLLGWWEADHQASRA
jgi:hypothetical protein